MLQFDDRGLVPAIVQDAETGHVLTLAYMNDEALRRTLDGPDVWFFSRSRGELWHKGKTSGNYLKVKRVDLDCDGDAVLVQAQPTGPACHTGRESCFGEAITDANAALAGAERRAGPGVLAELAAVIKDRAENAPEGSYTAELLGGGTERAAQKVIEEAGEVAIAGIKSKDTIAGEMADLLYHSLVLLEAAGVAPGRVWEELLARRQ